MKKLYGVRFQVLTVMSMKMTVFWDVTPYSLVDIDRRFRGTCCLHHQGNEYGGSKKVKLSRYTP
jgi:hypothetical protein